MNIPVVYEDDWLVVLDKPPGLVTIPTPKNESRTLTSILNDDLRAKGIPYRAHPCHRLDRETSGLIIFAKGKSIQKKMMQQFKLKKIKKTYIAFVQGIISKDRGIIDSAIENQPAKTEYKVIERRRGWTVVEINLLTGRTNQIRIHFKHIGHAVLGETKYAFRRDFKIKARRLCLHAKSLGFVHPVTGKKIFLDTELANGMREFNEI